MKKMLYISVVFILLLCLTGCEQKVNISFLRDENWRLKASADFDAGLAKDVGSIAGSLVGDLTSSDIPSGLFNPELYISPAMNMMKNALRSQGVDFDWKYDKEKLTYEMSATSFDFFQEAGMLHDLGNNQYQLTINSQDAMSLLDPEFQEMLTIMSQIYGNNEVQISAGEILRSNADEQTNTKAIWYNPLNVDVVFIPGSSINSGIWVLVLVGLILLGIIIFVIRKGSKKNTCPSCGGKVRKNVVDCPHCGSYIDGD